MFIQEEIKNQNISSFIECILLTFCRTKEDWYSTSLEFEIAMVVNLVADLFINECLVTRVHHSEAIYLIVPV